MHRKTMLVLMFSLVSFVLSLFLIFSLGKKEWLLPFSGIFTLGAAIFLYDTERKERR